MRVGYEAGMTSTAKSLYAGHRFPPELISYTVWLYFRFPLSLRMVEEIVPPLITWTPEKGYGVVGLGCGLPT